MKQISRRRYRVNKFKFVRGIIISSLFIGFVIYAISSMINSICNLVYSYDEKIIIDYSPILPSDTYIEIPESILAEIEKTYCKNNNVDNIKKPSGLEDIYYEQIVKVSNVENMPIEVILAIITTENELYDINAKYINSNGSVDMGLCQINSEYVDYFASKYNIENFDPYNVEQSVTFVARHLKYLSNYGKENYNLSEKDSYIFAAGAYNRGLNGECQFRNMYEYKEKFLKYYEKICKGE